MLIKTSKKYSLGYNFFTPKLNHMLRLLGDWN